MKKAYTTQLVYILPVGLV